MKTVFKIFLISLFLASCTSLKNSNSDVVAVITKKEDLDKYVGKLITIKGEITNTKVPTIIGVDVSIENAIKKYGDITRKIGMASGILIKRIVTDADDFSTNRGNGIFYRLKNPKNDLNSEIVIDIDDN